MACPHGRPQLDSTWQSACLHHKNWPLDYLWTPEQIPRICSRSLPKFNNSRLVQNLPSTRISWKSTITLSVIPLTTNNQTNGKDMVKTSCGGDNKNCYTYRNCWNSSMPTSAKYAHHIITEEYESSTTDYFHVQRPMMHRSATVHVFVTAPSTGNISLLTY